MSDERDDMLPPRQLRQVPAEIGDAEIVSIDLFTAAPLLGPIERSILMAAEQVTWESDDGDVVKMGDLRAILARSTELRVRR